MKRILQILMISVLSALALGISAYGAEVPEEIKAKGDSFYLMSHAFSKDNDHVLYFDGQILYTLLEFDDVQEYQFSVRNIDTGDWVHTEGIIHQDKPMISVDFSKFPSGDYMIRLFYNTTGNVYDDGYQYINYYAKKSDTGVCSFDKSLSANFKFCEEVYQCITEADYPYLVAISTPKESTEIYQLCKPIVDEITAGLTTDYDKARAIYTWIADNIYYDYPAYRSGNLTEAANAVSVMKTKRGVCSGYARVTDVMLTLAGIPTFYQSGKCSTIGHAWNVACIDGVWCYIDTTWGSANKYGYNDDEVYTKGDLNYQYFATTASFIDASRTLEPIFSNIIVNGIEYGLPYYPSLNKHAAIAEDYHNTTAETVVIPPSIGKIPVTEIANECFYNNDNVKNVYIPETVTSIDGYAFRAMDNFNIFILGKDTPMSGPVYSGCKNVTIYMPFSSPYFKGVDSYPNATVINTDYEINQMSHTSNTLTFDIHTGMFKNNPQLIVGLYDNDGKLCKTLMQQTNPNKDSYTFDTTGYGVSYIAKAFLMDTVNNLGLYCEPYRKRIAHIEDSGTTLESLHKYMNEDDETLTYAYPGTCHSLDVAFNDQTYVADNDYIYIYDANDTLIGTYTGSSLAGKTINILGNTIKIRLVSDEKTAAYGYKTSSIVVVKE